MLNAHARLSQGEDTWKLSQGEGTWKPSQGEGTWEVMRGRSRKGPSREGPKKVKVPQRSRDGPPAAAAHFLCGVMSLTRKARCLLSAHARQCPMLMQGCLKEKTHESCLKEKARGRSSVGAT